MIIIIKTLIIKIKISSNNLYIIPFLILKMIVYKNRYYTNILNKNNLI